VTEVFPGNYSEEYFYWIGTAGNRTTGLLVLALEAAFSVGPPIPGDQIPGRVTVNRASYGQTAIAYIGGTYKITGACTGNASGTVIGSAAVGSDAIPCGQGFVSGEGNGDTRIAFGEVEPVLLRADVRKDRDSALLL
jgi:hypothetical protein